jgi:hypothetical protein
MAYIKSKFESYEDVSMREARGMWLTHSILIQGTLSSSRPLHFVAGSHQATHFPSACKSSFHGLEPVTERVASFIVGCAKSLKAGQDVLLVISVVLVDHEAKHFEDKSSCGYMRGVE